MIYKSWLWYQLFVLTISDDNDHMTKDETDEQPQWMKIAFIITHKEIVQ